MENRNLSATADLYDLVLVAANPGQMGTQGLIVLQNQHFHRGAGRSPESPNPSFDWHPRAGSQFPILS
jgi:hypothetical protein